MDIEKSLSNLEKQIDAFRITGDGVAGSFKTGFTIGGTSGGGTGPTKIDEPQPEDHEGRIKALEKQFKNFTISGGAGVTVEGSMQYGFAINVQPEEGSASAAGGAVEPGICPRDDAVCVTFDSIVSCGCTGLYEMTDISMNGTFELAKVVDSGSLVDWQGLGGMVHVIQYESDGCTGAIVNEDDVQLNIELGCDDVDGYTLNYYFDFGGFRLAYEASNSPGEGSFPVGTPISNQAVCGDSVRLGTSGTATVTLGPCP